MFEELVQKLPKPTPLSPAFIAQQKGPSIPSQHLSVESVPHGHYTSLLLAGNMCNSDSPRNLATTISIYYFRGSAPYPEDRPLVSPNILALFDGVSAPYSGSPPLFNRVTGAKDSSGQTGGACIADLATETLSEINSEKSIKSVVSELNSKVADWQILSLERMKDTLPNEQYLKRKNFSSGVGQYTPGVVGAVAKIGPGNIHVLQWGDTHVFGRYSDGKLVYTKSQVVSHDLEQTKKIEELMNKHLPKILKDPALIKAVVDEKTWNEYNANPTEQDKARIILTATRAYMWRDYAPYMAERRGYRVNNTEITDGYGFLNGEKSFEGKVKNLTIQRTGLTDLVLATDGLFPLEDTQDPLQLCRKFFSQYDFGGIQAVQRYACEQAEAKSQTSHASYPEGTAILVKLEGR